MPHNKPPGDLPDAAEKGLEKAKLVSKGIPMQQASFLVGDGEELTRKEIAQRRIDWQKNLPKG